MKKAKELDKFYTLDNVSKKCVNIFKARTKTFLNHAGVQYIEPSAGAGSFLKSLPVNDMLDGKNKVLAYDLYPENPFVVKKDFLKSNINTSKLINQKKNIVILGNPPFGKRSKLAIDFFNKSSEYADTIAFIVPMQFCKYSVQSKLNPDFKLIYEEKLQSNSFTLNNKSYSVRCVFQIWTKNKKVRRNLRIKTPPPTKHKDFEIFQHNATSETEKYLNKDKYKWDFAIPRQGYNNYSQKIVRPEELSPNKQWMFIKVTSKEVLSNLEKIDFVKLSLMNTTVPGFGKADVIDEYIKMFG